MCPQIPVWGRANIETSREESKPYSISLIIYHIMIHNNHAWTKWKLTILLCESQVHKVASGKKSNHTDIFIKFNLTWAVKSDLPTMKSGNAHVSSEGDMRVIEQTIFNATDHSSWVILLTRQVENHIPPENEKNWCLECGVWWRQKHFYHWNVSKAWMLTFWACESTRSIIERQVEKGKHHFQYHCILLVAKCLSCVNKLKKNLPAKHNYVNAQV